MTFNSISFLIFFPVVTICYYLFPHRIRWIWLLVCSYFFYMSWNPKYVLLIVFSTVVTWAGAGMIRAQRRNGEEDSRRTQRWILAACILANLLILGFFKYFNFFSRNISGLMEALHLGVRTPQIDVLLPVGISFYTFQALGYLIDVYRGDVDPEPNLARYALFVSFFPQLVAGPIERSGNLLGQLRERHAFNPEQVMRGLLQMSWGFFKKLVIADRAAVFVTAVFDQYAECSGVSICLAVMLFAFQIYCDFSGYSDIAVGAARTMGISLMKNFDRPYFARTTAEFWRKWHISLTTWFRDYVYIPLGGNRHGKLKKYVNILFTFLLSGLWHGASWNFVVWGVMNGFFQVAGEVTSEIRSRGRRLLHIREDGILHRIFRTAVTFLLVDFAWLFFRAPGLRDALLMIRHAFRHFTPGSVPALENGAGVSAVLDVPEIIVLAAALLILFAVDFWSQKRDLIGAVLRRNVVIRFLIYYIILFILLIFGIYGPAFDASSFIYFQF